MLRLSGAFVAPLISSHDPVRFSLFFSSFLLSCPGLFHRAYITRFVAGNYRRNQSEASTCDAYQPPDAPPISHCAGNQPNELDVSTDTRPSGCTPGSPVVSTHASLEESPASPRPDADLRITSRYNSSSMEPTTEPIEGRAGEKSAWASNARRSTSSAFLEFRRVSELY